MRKKILSISLALSGVLLITLIALLISVVKNIQVAEKMFAGVFLMLSNTFGIYYLLDGCKKGDSAKFYVCYMGALGFCDLIAIMFSKEYPAVVAALFAICIACYSLLCFSKDLGQKKSYIFSISALVSELIIMIIAFVTIGGFSIFFFSRFALAAVAVFMVYAKYFDKALRGSK